MNVEVLIEDERWKAAGLAALAEAVCRAMFVHMQFPEAMFEVSFFGCDDARITVLNAEFREKPSATNVLSWPAVDLRAPRPGGAPARPDWDPNGMPTELGDIAIAFETCTREAAAQGKSFEAHVRHLLLHGLLHLVGYDHINDADAALMENLEIEILGKMGVLDPYRDTGG